MRYLTNEKRRSRTLFKPTLWAVASWLIFGIAHSLRFDWTCIDMLSLLLSQDLLIFVTYL